MSWYLDVLRSYAQRDGRARRMECWMFILVSSIIGIGMQVVGMSFGLRNYLVMNMLAIFYTVVTIVPTIALGVRRLHDIGRSGRWMLIALVPVVGAITLLVLFALDGERGANEYGLNPKSVRA